MPRKLLLAQSYKTTTNWNNTDNNDNSECNNDNRDNNSNDNKNNNKTVIIIIIIIIIMNPFPLKCKKYIFDRNCEIDAFDIRKLIFLSSKQYVLKKVNKNIIFNRK